VVIDMATDQEQLKIVSKEMGITHKEFYAELSRLLDGASYQHTNNTITFQFKCKKLEIILAPEGIRQLGQSLSLPVTFVTFHFVDFTDEEINVFIRHFNLIFMKGGG
jgi:hypothetical protein